MSKDRRTILLVVDDESAVCRALLRLLKGKADEIITVQNSTDAEIVLKTKPVTHVLCDHLLGPGQLTGLELTKNWKETYSTLEKVIILTGININQISATPGIDMILPKTTDPVDLTAKLDFC